MATPALSAAATSVTVFALGSVANAVASNKPLATRSWLPTGGFVGVVNGAGAAPVAVAEPAAAPSSPTAPQQQPSRGKNVPIGGNTDKPAPPCPFGRFPKHKPTKLPGPPAPYDPANSP